MNLSEGKKLAVDALLWQDCFRAKAHRRELVHQPIKPLAQRSSLAISSRPGSPGSVRLPRKLIHPLFDLFLIVKHDAKRLSPTS
jgi:hypothetical protein